MGTTFFFTENLAHEHTVWAAIFAVLALAAYLSFVYAIVIKLRVRFDREEVRPAGQLEQWLDRIRSSECAVRSQAAPELAHVHRESSAPRPYMPPDYEGLIPDPTLLLAPSTRKEIAWIVLVLHRRSSHSCCRVPSQSLSVRRSELEGSAVLRALQGASPTRRTRHPGRPRPAPGAAE